MNLLDYIVNDITPLQLTSTVKDARQLFSALIYTHLPVVVNGNLVGLIAESDLYVLTNEDEKLENIQHLLQNFAVKEDTNWLTLLKYFSVNETNLLPIFNSKKGYLGYFELADILHIFNSTPFLQELGSFLIVSKLKEDFLLSEVVQIVEQNNAQLFGAFISKEDVNTEVTLKIKTQDINEILQTFRRYNYTIVSKINEDDYINDLKERSEYLQKYLNM